MKRFLLLGVVLLMPLLRLDAAAPATMGSRAAAAISSYLQGAVSRSDTPGVVALVVNRDKVLYHQAFGTLNDRQKVAMTGDAIFNIASMTKPVTSAAVMMLVEQGKLRLDDEAATYLPALARLQVLDTVDITAGSYSTRPARRPITIRHLLTHASGIG